MRQMLASGILPAGSLQFVSGSARELIDHLDYRDLVGFTGSASTARALKAHPNVVHGGVRFTSETDSLNAAILGPDAEPGTPEFDAYVASVVTEMTSKAGQKCTSIRRIIVPAGRVTPSSPPSPSGSASGSASATRAPRASPWGRSRASTSAARCSPAPPASSTAVAAS